MDMKTKQQQKEVFYRVTCSDKEMKGQTDSLTTLFENKVTTLFENKVDALEWSECERQYWGRCYVRAIKMTRDEFKELPEYD